MAVKSFLQRFRKLDAYAKPLEDVRIRTTTGASVTLVSGMVILSLMFFEIYRYITPEMQAEIVVDGGKMEKLPISFNITFPHLPCYLLGLDLMDESGDHISDYDHDVFKVRLDDNGREIHREKAKELSNSGDRENLAAQENEDYCGPCYGANPKGVTNPCCNTCDDVRKAYSDMGWAIDEKTVEQCWKENISSQSKEGCNMHGDLMVNKVRGNFHFSPGKSYVHGGSHIHDVRTYLATEHDFSHVIHHLQFGAQNHHAYKQKRTELDALTNPLDGTQWGNVLPTMMYNYHLKIVSSEFNYLNGKHLRTFQYSVSRQERDLRKQGGGGLPGVFFIMDFSPMLVIYSEYRGTFASFLVGVCAIVGGIFTVASLVDGVLYRASMHQKREFGKAM
ncbi:endoplasmic reticulum vesicle transporter-domain-containing protein [Zychaea mexicana]|uniref:endoplasmic reticulum vesicle transporter-domain-containing protein n=1 Tax=Zychaea mexicana TaxID=64656 RepID=UPI0022FE60CA|nr:endoplasmic reticulum vesicle transporter-domain-containing protein [Zychaea mexicana]KAI9498508.1 endoplasmic reticulum vesicle transporter-domain-containing protein [Zychaea mexicana]